VSSLPDLLGRLEELLAELDELDEPGRGLVSELLDGLDALHRSALKRLVAGLDPVTLERVRGDGAVAWLLDAYGVGIDERAAADAAVDSIRPYIHSHGGKVEVIDAQDGVVSLRLAGACSGCTASAITLREGVEEALREGFPGFVRLEVEEDRAEPHAPPAATLLQIAPLRPDS
jgi:Fe-S cluster biogenesis protein NfuA